MKKTSKAAARKLVLRTESVAVLSAAQLAAVDGAALSVVAPEPRSQLNGCKQSYELACRQA